jgi:hypothetical protein
MNETKARLALLDRACAGVEFADVDPTGAVKALVEALRPFASMADLSFDDAPDIATITVWLRECRAARSALARVRLATDGDADEEGGTK